VLPTLLPPDLNPKYFARQLMAEHGLWVSPIWFIAKPRIRITANALHTQDEMDRLVDGMVQVRDSMYAASKSA
jgi:glycine C-acetyltransferase